MTIRPATPSDESRIYELICILESRTLPRDAFSRTYAHNLAASWVRYLVAEIDGAVAGFASVHMDQQLHHASLVGELQELIVDETVRGRGIGAALLAAAQDAARAAGCSHMELNSGFARSAAHAFYERHGWVKDHYNFTYKRWHTEDI